MPSPSPADRRNAFYVPSAAVSLGTENSRLLQFHGLAATQVEVDLQLSVAGLFKFTIPNCFDAKVREFRTARGNPVLDLLKLGTRVWIRMGYGDVSGTSCLFSGYINSVTTSFSEDHSPELEVSGQDALYPLTLGTHEHRNEKASLKDAVTEVAKRNGLRLDMEKDPPKDVTLDSNMQSDMEFLRKLVENFAKRKEKWEFYSPADKQVDVLHFGPRQTDAAELATLEWGVDLLSFKPEINLGNQVGKVEVCGWDELKKETILGEARAGSAGGKAKTGGQIQSGFLPNEVVRRIRLPVRTKQEADERAEAELAGALNDHLKGEGETFGMPELRPDTRVRLAGLGAKFSRSYYVTRTTHRYDASGYRTRFSVEEPMS